MWGDAQRLGLATDRHLLATLGRAHRARPGVLRIYSFPGDVLAAGRWHLAPVGAADAGEAFVRRLTGGRALALGEGYLGLSLLALSFVAVGLFTSSLTQNQIVAAITSFGLLILLYVISWPAEAGGGIVSSVLTYLSLPAHFSTMTRGVIDTSDVVFFLSVIVLALFLTQRSVESARWR